MSAETITANAAQEDMVVAAQGVPVQRYSSLMVTSIPRAKKRAVLVLEESNDELTVRLAGLRNLHHSGREESEIKHEIVPESPAFDEPEPVIADGGLLLAKKPPKVSSDFRDMLGPRDPDLQQRLQSLLATHAPAAPLTLREPAAVAESAPVPDWPAEPVWLEAERSEEIPDQAPVEDWDEVPLDERPKGIWATLKGWLSRLVPRRFG